MLIPIKHIDSELKSYNDEFLGLLKGNCNKDLTTFNRQVIIRKGSLDYPVVGLCVRGLTNLFIIVDKDAWSSYTETQRYQLFMHEATHCYLNFKHQQNVFNYMNDYLVNLDKDSVTNQVIDNIKEACK